MRQAHHMTIDRALLLYILHLIEPHGLYNDVRLQQLCFLCELQLFSKGFRALHFEFFRFAYGAFSKDLDNDLLSLRRKEKVENFSVVEQVVEEIVPLITASADAHEPNKHSLELIQAVVATYAAQDTTQLTKSVEDVALTTPEQPELKLPIRDISFHTIMLVPHRIEVANEFTLPPRDLAKLNKLMGY
ncbi:MAG: hypothetical protein U0172_06770 [Nitrospiraceae bacterium]